MAGRLLMLAILGLATGCGQSATTTVAKRDDAPSSNVDTAMQAPALSVRPPRAMVGPVAWARDNLFSSWGNAILTIAGAYIIYQLVTGVVLWGLVYAVWTGEDGKACSKGTAAAACWPFITAKFNQFMYGRFPDSETWRVKLTYVLGLAGLIPLMVPRVAASWSRYLFLGLFVAFGLMLLLGIENLPIGNITGSRRIDAMILALGLLPIAVLMNLAIAHKGLNLAYLLALFPVIAYWLLTGGTTADTKFGWFQFEYLGLAALVAAATLLVVAGLADGLGPSTRMAMRAGAALLLYIAFLAGVRALFSLGAVSLPIVKTELWGGMLVTLVVAVVGVAGSFPVGVALALGRRSKMPIARWVSIGFIEFVRGVPLISILFMAAVMLPLFLPDGVSFDKLLRALIGVMLFQGAYMAETIRGGLQAIPRGQGEAAEALGLGYGQKMGLVVLPQALKLVIPGIVNSIVGLSKDTSLVLIIGIFDLLGIVQLNLADSKWFSPNTAMTGYAFVAFLFWILCFSISRYSQWMERRLNTSR